MMEQVFQNAIGKSNLGIRILILEDLSIIDYTC